MARAGDQAGLERSVRRRLERCEGQIDHTLLAVRRGNPLAAEPDRERLEARLRTKADLSREEAEAVAIGIRSTGIPRPRRFVAARRGFAGPEKVWGSTLDFVNVSFLERGFHAARSVGRVTFLDGRPQGTGWMISDRLFITNNHVISSQNAAAGFCVEFDYELDLAGNARSVSRFRFDPGAFFITDDRDDLDYTVIAIGERNAGSAMLASFGYSPLSNATDKHVLGEVANIIQHPDGRYKEVVVRENRLVSRLDSTLHYVADTEPGSSGSPVYNNDWQVIALHHWGGPWRQKADDDGKPIPREVNEGIRISAIVRELRATTGLTPNQEALLQRALALGAERAIPKPFEPSPIAGSGVDSGMRVDASGRATWTIPIEVSVRLPGRGEPPIRNGSPRDTVVDTDAPAPAADSGEKAIRPSDNFSDRSGYKRSFIPGHPVDLPALSAKLKTRAARNKDAEAGDDPFELKYHHFSIVMDKTRKVAMYTACNIDGEHAKHVDRDTGKVTVLKADDPHLESLNEESEAEGAEATEGWYQDIRIDSDEQPDQSLYDDQDVPGFVNDRRNPKRIARMFQRGHLVRRMDPAWGTAAQARLADADTFHFTNCSPQIGFFNMGTAKALKLKKSGGGKLWRALENHVLRNAVADGLRVTSFTGPVLDDKNDIEWRSIKVPTRFWKIVVWAEGGQLRSLAMLADQKPVLDAVGKLPEAASDAEAFDELQKVKDFVSTVKEVERLTGLNFGEAVRAGDIRFGGESRRLVTEFEKVSLRPVSRSRARR